MTNSNGEVYPLIWLDVETTGLEDDKNDTLLQVAAFATDHYDHVMTKDGVAPFFNGFTALSREGALEDAFERAAQRSDGERSDFVYNMHCKSGVWATCAQDSTLGTIDERNAQVFHSYAHLDAALSDWITDIFDGAKPDFGGSSITLDRNFLRRYVPHSFSRINYRSLDTSSVRNWLTASHVETPVFENDDAAHNGLDDCVFSLALSAHFADVVLGKNFVPNLISEMSACGLPTASVERQFLEAR